MISIDSINRLLIQVKNSIVPPEVPARRFLLELSHARHNAFSSDDWYNISDVELFICHKYIEPFSFAEITESALQNVRSLIAELAFNIFTGLPVLKWYSR